MNAPSKDPQLDALKVPPHSIEAEQSVIGGLLLDNAAWDRIADVMSHGDFYRYDHRIIYEAIGKLIATTRPADVITVYEALTNTGKAEEVGGLAYLNALAQNTPSAANIRRYAEIVRDRAVLRAIAAASTASRRAAVQSGAAQLLGGAFGPFLASQAVDDHHARGVIYLGSGLALAGMAIIAGLRFTARPQVQPA